MAESMVLGPVCDSCPPSFIRSDVQIGAQQMAQRADTLVASGIQEVVSAYLPVTVASSNARGAGKSEAQKEWSKRLEKLWRQLVAAKNSPLSLGGSLRNRTS